MAAGTWIYERGATVLGGGGGGGTENPPPNITVTGLTIGGLLDAHNTAAVFGGVIHYPTTSPDYPNMDRVEVYFRYPTDPPDQWLPIMHYGKPVPPASTLTFSGLWHHQIALGTAAVSNCKLRFIPYGVDGTTGDAFDLTFTLPALGITSLTGTETLATRWQDNPDRNVHSVVTASVSKVAAVPFYVTVWINQPADSLLPGRRWQGWYPVDAVKIGAQGGGSEGIFTPLKDEQWTITLEVGIIDANVDPSAAAVTSPPFNVVKIQPPANGLITDIIVPAGASGNFPYDVEAGDGSHYWKLDSVDADTAAAYPAVNVWTIQLTTHDFDAAGNFVFGPEHAYVDHVPIQGVTHFGDLIGPYGDNGSGFFIRAWAINRLPPAPGLKPWEDPAVATFQCERKVVVSIDGSNPGSAAAPPPPPDVAGLTASGTINKKSGAFTLTVDIDPPDVLGSFAGGHVYAEIPDQSAAGGGAVVGETPVGASTPTTGEWKTLDLGKFPWSPTTPRAFIVHGQVPPGVSLDLAIPSRVYVASFSSKIDNVLTRAGADGETPSATFNLIPQDSTTPGSGSGVTVTAGDITAMALPPDNSTGKLKTPVMVMVSSVPNTIDGWCYRIVITWDEQDPTVEANQFPMTGEMHDPGPVYASADGIAVPHTFVVDTPADIHPVIVWCQSGLADATGVVTWNDIVPGVTPSFPISIGTNNGTTDATQFMTDTINSTMAVVNDLFGIAPAGVTNPYLGSGSVATINIQNLAVTNPLLAALAVSTTKLVDLAVDTTKLADLAATAAKLADSSVTSGKIADLAVASADLADDAVINAKLASLAVTSGKLADNAVDAAKLADLAVDAAALADSSVTSTKIASAAVGSAAIAALAVGNAAIAALAVDSAKMADLAVTDAKIANAAVGSAAIANLAVGTAAMQLLAVDTTIVANLAVSTGKMQDLTVTGAKIANATIANGNLGSLCVASGNIADLAVTNAKVSATITTDKIVAGLFNGHTLICTNAGVTTSIAIQGANPPVPNTYVGIRVYDASNNWSGMSPTGVGTFNLSCFGILFADALQIHKVSDPNAGLNSVAIRLGTTNGSNPGLWFNGVQVLNTRYSRRPRDLAGIIDVLVHHGLCDEREEP